MKKTKHIMAFSCLLCIFVGAFILSFTSPSMAATFCVGTSAELQSALTVSGTNSQDDSIQVQQGTYYGNFIYASTEAFGVTMEGGYNAGCFVRVVDATNTVLDAQNSGRVLELNASGVAADLVVDGITLQNGNVTLQNGSGIFVNTDSGRVFLKNNEIKNNLINNTGNGSGAYIYGNEDVTLINNIIKNNNAGGHVGGVVIWDVGSVTITQNTIVNNQSASTGGGIGIGTDLYGKLPETINFIGNTIDSNTANGSGGFYLKGNGTVIVSDNIITNNSANAGGGGDIRGGSNGVVSFFNNTVSFNIAQTSDIAGVTIAGDKEVLVKNNIINNNTSNQYFGGLRITGTESVRVENNIISNNSGTHAAGLYIDFPDLTENSSVKIVNNTICYNLSTSEGGGVYLNIYDETDLTDIYNNIILYNTAAEGADLYIDNDDNNNGTPSPVNLFNNDFDRTNGFFIKVDDSSVVYSNNLNNEDPLFDIDGSHLTKDSPCIDAGVDAGVYDDIDGDTRPQGAGYDIGADEYVISDSDGDGIPDDEDACPSSDLSDTVVIDGCDSGVENVLLDDGCTISDLIFECADNAKTHGKFVRCVSHLTNYLKKGGTISGKKKGKIQKCVAKADNP